MYQRIVTPEWSMPRQLTGQRRLLVESPNPIMGVADFNAFQEAGFEVAVCGGPEPDGNPCPLTEDEECPFALVADVVLYGLDAGSGNGHGVIAALRRHHPGTPVVVAYPAGDQAALDAIPEGCITLPLPASLGDTIAVLTAAASGRV